MTKQLIGIADHTDALADGIVRHLGHHRFIHLTREITVKGLTSEMAGVGDTANRCIDGGTAGPGGNHQGPAELIPEPLGKSLQLVADIKTAVAFAGKFIFTKTFTTSLPSCSTFKSIILRPHWSARQPPHRPGPEHSQGLVNVPESTLS